ncbi:unnamed protein product [Kluyveromyces dobzhanskii CBS 2104]|uniref:WGS project CCBQ000000000 data, contig 00009 n=1 Tax=Kluyveromyces dobzhanskii CBS 2104 TaxID=1427455 RepID=A0A0A8L2V5_9SACH|nr:unnamed protein product [Kluyveromyces dobzhanskii CBS 2104]
METASVPKSASSVETSVTKLLISTKQLLQILTQWSKGKATERNVSDVYVQLGNDFKLVTRQFSHAKIDIADLGDVPKELRRILEVALRETASEETLDKYLPQIREIIVKLLEKLKVKQAMLKLKRNEDSTKYQPQNKRSSVSSLISVTTSLADSRPSVRTTPSPDSRSNSISTTSDHKPSGSLEIPKTTESDALTQLKKGNNLQRRASKRFSAYHMAKLANQTASDPTKSPTSKNLSVPIPTAALADPETKRKEKHLSQISSTSSVEYHPMTGEPETRSDVPSEGEVVIFLKVGDRVKRCVTGYQLTFNKLRLLFVEKFAYTSGGDVFPDIYMKEPKYESFFELEESQLHNVQDGSVFQLQIQKSSFDEQFRQLENGLVEKQDTLFQNLKELIQNFTHIPSSDSPNDSRSSNSTAVQINDHRREVAQIKHEITILKQIHSSQKNSLQNTIDTIVAKLQKFQGLSINTGKSVNRDYMEKSQSKLSEVSDNLLSKVDDLQDVIEALRKDVAIRGAKTPKKKIESVSAELASAKKDLDQMRNYIEVEKPNWKTIWEAELDRVCEEQQFMTLQEDLTFDLEEDLQKVIETFDLVKMCCEQQEKAPKKNNKGNPILPIAKPGTYNMIRNQVLTEVQNLNPDHDSRVEAILKAEKLRTREKEYKENEAFEDELGNFVEKGNFKKAGGIEEIERLRKQKDEENLRVNFGIL